MGGFSFAQPSEEIRDLVDEGVFVANLQARHPPVFHIRMVAVRDVEGAPAPQFTFVAMVKVLQPMQIMEIPGNGSIFAINFKSIKRLVAARVTGGLEGGQRAVVETSQERAGVVD